MKPKPCSCFLAYNFDKNLRENGIMKIFVPFFLLCSARLLVEIRFAVCKFVKSHNNNSFNIELACSVRIGKVVVSFFFWKFKLPKEGTRPICFPVQTSR